MTAPVPFAFVNHKVAEPYLGSLLRAEWLTPGTPHRGPAVEVVDDLPLFAELYDAVRWWAWATCRPSQREAAGMIAEYEAAARQVAEWVARIEAERFPKHPGRHCPCCPVRAECLGLNP